MYSGLGECRHGGGREPQVAAAPLQMTHTHYDDLRPWHCEPNIISQKQPRREEMRTRPRNRVDARNKHSHFLSACALQISLRCFSFLLGTGLESEGKRNHRAHKLELSFGTHFASCTNPRCFVFVCVLGGCVCLCVCGWVSYFLLFFFFFFGLQTPFSMLP